MFIDKSMTKKVITVSGDTSVLDTRGLMRSHKIRHLPVVDKDQLLLGIVTDRDVRSAMPSVSLNECSTSEKQKFLNLTVKDIMTADPITLSPMYTLQDALLLIQQQRYYFNQGSASGLHQCYGHRRTRDAPGNSGG